MQKNSFEEQKNEGHPKKLLYQAFLIHSVKSGWFFSFFLGHLNIFRLEKAAHRICEREVPFGWNDRKKYPPKFLSCP